MTYTLAQLALSQAAYDEIKAKMEDAGYQHAIIDDLDGEMIDMTHIAVVVEEASADEESDDFKQYSKSLRKLHQFIDDGLGDSDEADELREDMLDDWNSMSDTEQKRARQLSVDMKAVS